MNLNERLFVNDNVKELLLQNLKENIKDVKGYSRMSKLMKLNAE